MAVVVLMRNMNLDVTDTSLLYVQVCTRALLSVPTRHMPLPAGQRW